VRAVTQYAWDARRIRQVTLVAAGTRVAATRVRDATHGILRKRGGDCAEAEEGSERKCEREFHDPSPFGSRDHDSKWARCTAGQAFARAKRYRKANQSREHGKFSQFQQKRKTSAA
jgi:hypothetical protein